MEVSLISFSEFWFGTESKLSVPIFLTGNLDSKNSKMVFGILKELAHKDGYCVIMITHDEELGKSADKTIRLHDGEIS